MSEITPNDLIGAEVIDTGYYDEPEHEYDWIFLKLKNGRIAKVGPTNWETMWVSYEGGKVD